MRTSADSNVTNNGNGTASSKELTAQLQVSKEVAIAEKARLENEIAITNQQKQQLELQMRNSTFTAEQQTQYKAIVDLQNSQTAALNNYNSILKSVEVPTPVVPTSTEEEEGNETDTSSKEESSEDNGSAQEPSGSTDEGSYLGTLLGGGAVLGVGRTITGALEPILKAIPGIGTVVGEALGVINELVDKGEALLTGIADILEGGIQTALQEAANHQGTIAARLYGLQDTTTSIDKQVNAYDLILQDIQTAGFFASSFVSTQDLIGTIEKYAEAGIVYNIEQRAFIGTIQDQLVTTFNAMQSWLTRTVRIQQSDMTMQFLGLEATLNENLTKWFADTSYLSDKYDSVTGALLDAISAMNTDETIEFQYSVQKWLGALYSLGADTLVDTIAKGLNQLATGDVQGLQSNTTVQTLFAQALSRAGESYSDWITTGLTASRVDTLMESIIELLQDVVTNTDGNNVTRAAYAESVYGISISDLNAVYNMTQQDISNLTSSTMTATKAMESWNTQIENYIMNRVNIAQRLDTVVDNLLFSFGRNIEQNDAAYMGWYIADVLDEFASTDKSGSGIFTRYLKDVSEGTSAWMYFKEIWDFGGDLLENMTTAFGNFLGTGGQADVETFQRGFTKLVGSIFDWVDILDETRGTGFSVSTTSNTVSETGISSSITTSNLTAQNSTEALSQAIDTNFYTLASQAAQVAAETISSNEQSTTNDANEIYNELFERQNTPVRVTLSSIESEALKSMKEELKNEIIENIYNHLVDGVINVKSTDTADAFSVLTNIRTMT